MKLYATDSEFSTHFPRFEFFYEQNSLLATLELTQSRVNSNVNNLHFITYFTHRGQSPDRQQHIKEPSLNIILFSCSVYLPFYVIAMYLWLGSIGDATVSVCFSQ